jgi:low temperature requirement protein LtrA
VPRPCSGQRSPTIHDHRATPLELFFDLAYIFAATQVTAYMA